MAHPSQMLYLDSLRAPGALCIESKRGPAGQPRDHTRATSIVLQRVASMTRPRCPCVIVLPYLQVEGPMVEYGNKPKIPGPAGPDGPR